MNTLGKNFVFTSFGESHGRAIGGVLDGVPAGVRIDLDRIREALDKRGGRFEAKGDEAIRREAGVGINRSLYSRSANSPCPYDIISFGLTSIYPTSSFI